MFVHAESNNLLSGCFLGCGSFVSGASKKLWDAQSRFSPIGNTKTPAIIPNDLTRLSAAVVTRKQSAYYKNYDLLSI